MGLYLGLTHLKYLLACFSRCNLSVSVQYNRKGITILDFLSVLFCHSGIPSLPTSKIFIGCENVPGKCCNFPVPWPFIQRPTAFLLINVLTSSANRDLFALVTKCALCIFIEVGASVKKCSHSVVDRTSLSCLNASNKSRCKNLVAFRKTA